MEQGDLLAQRLRWLRREQGITLQHLADRCGRATSYLCQLEGGARANPTRQTVEVLAHALGVRPAFLFGEAPAAGEGARAAGAEAGVDPHTISRLFSEQVAAMPEAQREALLRSTPAQRFATVARFLVDRFPDHFTLIELAYGIGLSYRTWQELLADRVELSHHAMAQMARVSGLPVAFFAFGTLEPPPAPPVDLADLMRYLEPLKLAMAHNLSPEQLAALIRAAGGLT